MGILGDVTITKGPYNEPGGAYMFYGTVSSYIEFPNRGGLDTRFSITLMCWIQRRGQYGPVFSYGDSVFRVRLYVHFGGALTNQIVERGSFASLLSTTTVEVLPVGKWVHVAASYDHNTGINAQYINGHLSVSRNIGKGYEIATDTQIVRMGSIDGGIANFKGQITEMKVYDVALNETQIRTSIRQGS